MTENDFRALFAARVGTPATDGQIGALYGITDALMNAPFNLTAIKEPGEIVSKHIADSLAAAEAIASLAKPGDTLLDVGSGAGFPALPLAVMLDGVRVTAMDATAKKAAYIAETAKAVGLDVSVLSGRAEAFGAAAPHREAYRFVTARAVARLNVLLELTAPFLAPGGTLVLMKGALAEEEAAEAKRGIQALGLSVPEIRPYHLPGLDDARALVICKKIHPTPPSYPRPYAQIVKKPL